MRWENKSYRPPFMFSIPCLHAKEIVSNAYLEKYINWNVYNKVIQKINTRQNGSWMFEHKQTRENSHLPIINRNDLIKATDHLWIYLHLFITDDMMHDHQKIMPKLSITQQTLLTFYLFDGVMCGGSSNLEENWSVNGGFLRLIYEGYGEYVFEKPFSDIILYWGAEKISSIVEKARGIYEKHKDRVIKVKTMKELSDLCMEINDFNVFDNIYMENSIEEAIVIKQYIEYNTSEFAIIDESNTQVSYIDKDIKEMENRKKLFERRKLR